MATKKQIKANKENAKRGGVKTPEGKAIVRFNALKHGLLSREVLLESEDEKSLTELYKRLQSEIKPQTEIEVILTDRIIVNIWRLRRVLEVERNSMEWRRNYKEIDFGMDDESESQKKKKRIKAMIVNDDMDKIIRYETTIERSIYRALHELQRVQSARKGEKPPAPLAIDISQDK